MSGEINWRGPVIDLDRTPLLDAEMLEMAMRIRRVHRVAYGAASSSEGVSDRVLRKFISEVASSRFRVAKPRLLTRVLIDELERARQMGGLYQAPTDSTAIVAEVAEHLAKDAAL